MIQADKTLSLRGMYYKTLHSIPGTKEKTFDDQEESDPISGSWLHRLGEHDGTVAMLGRLRQLSDDAKGSDPDVIALLREVEQELQGAITVGPDL